MSNRRPKNKNNKSQRAVTNNGVSNTAQVTQAEPVTPTALQPVKESTRTSRGVRAPGMSDASKAESQRIFNEEVESGKESITLPLDHGRTVSFVLREFKADKIEDETGVVKANARFQHNLNRCSLSDILATLKTKGQQFPAIGYLDAKTGKALAFDGSRRRKSCILDEVTFRMYVTEEQLAPKDIRYLTRIASVQKELSAFERGAIYQEMLDEGVYAGRNELAREEGIPPTTVSECLAAYNLPRELTEYIPDLNVFGRGSVTKANNAITLCEDKNSLSKLWDFIKTLTLEKLQDYCGGNTSNKLNAAFLKQIESFTAAYKPKKEKPARRVSVASQGKSTCFVKTSKNGFNLDIEHVEEGKKAAILAAIKEIIEG